MNRPRIKIYIPREKIASGATMNSKDAEHLKLAAQCRVEIDGIDISGSVFAFHVLEDDGSGVRRITLECRDFEIIATNDDILQESIIE